MSPINLFWFRKTILLSCLLFFCSGNYEAQSLTELYQTEKADKATINSLNEWAWELRYGNTDSSLFLAEKAVLFAKKLKWNDGLAKALYYRGYFRLNKGEYPLALNALTDAQKLFEQTGNNEFTALTLCLIGRTYSRQHDYANAIQKLYEGKALLEKLRLKQHYPEFLTALGWIYAREGFSQRLSRESKDSLFSAALKLSQKALTIDEELKNEDGLARDYYNIAFVIIESVRTGANADRKFNDSVNRQGLHYYKKAINQSLKIGNRNLLPTLYGNSGHVFFQLAENTLDPFKRDSFFSASANLAIEAVKMQEKLGLNNKTSVNLGYVAKVNMLRKNYKEARKYFDKALDICSSNNDMYWKMMFELDYSNLEKECRNFEAAYLHHLKYSEAKDSLTNEEAAKKQAQAEMQEGFNKEKQALKDAEGKKLLQKNAELSRQTLLRNTFIAGLVLLLLFFIVVIRQNRKIAKAKKRAEESERFKQQFLANMSHEIRTPMNAVMGMTNLLLDKKPEKHQLKYLDGIKKSSDTLLHIINDILDLSKIEAGKIELEQIDFSIHEVVEQVTSMLQHKAEEKDLQLVTTIKNIPKVVVGDPVRLNQVLMNLMGNAIKFTEKGSVELRVTPVDSKIKFEVIDTGIGIPKDKLNSVFESFSQANASDTRKFGGTGLGLTISKQLVELHGGNISIESESGKGSIFTFAISYPAGSEEKLIEQKTATEIDGTILNGLKILLTDDNEYNRTVAKDTLLSKAKVLVDEAQNGKECLEALQKNNYDIILMDVQMPVMDGYEATRLVRKLSSEKSKIPIIALTASVIRSDLDKCKEAGMNDYVPKPFKASELIAAIAKSTGKKVSLSHKKTKNSEHKTVNQKSGSITDLTYLTNFCEGDKVRMKKYIDMFLSTAPAFTEKINIALKNEDYEEIANQVHGYKTKWIMMGMKESKDLALNIEQQCRGGNEIEEAKSNTLILISQINMAIKELST